MRPFLDAVSRTSGAQLAAQLEELQGQAGDAPAEPAPPEPRPGGPLGMTSQA